jgi:hypothetical protein
VPDNTSAAALAVTVAAGGALSKAETIPLVTVEEGIEAFRRAGSVAYRTPGQ